MKNSEVLIAEKWFFSLSGNERSKIREKYFPSGRMEKVTNEILVKTYKNHENRQ